MPRVYELPTHLQVEDQLIAGLSARQLLRLVICASLAFGIWDQVRWLPDEVRLAVTLVVAAIGLLFALLQPGGRAFEQCLLAGLLFVMLPRRRTWHPGAAPLRPPSRAKADWAELELHPEWLGIDMPPEGEESRPPSRFKWFMWRWSWRRMKP
ncbi:MAG: PrgI family protein [Chloroflexota bacterium]|nr:PrgI family protein [Chloroflexota bacterium]